MASTYTPTAGALGSLTIPDDGDAANAASVNTPIEDLADAVAYNGAFGTRVRDVAYDVETGVAAEFFCDSGTSVDWQDTGTQVIVATEALDRLVCTCQCDTDLGNPGAHSIRLAHAQGSAATAEVAGTERLLDGTDRVGHTLHGVWQATNTELVTVKLQARAAAGDFSVYAGIALSVMVIARAAAWPVNGVVP